jgi:rod shape-determining protein MreD
MAEPMRSAPWGWRTLFVALFGLDLLVRLLPLGGGPGGMPGPDIMLCIACAWVLRRPDYVPAALIALVIFAEDLLLMRPPGLWAALVLVGTEFLRSRAAFSRELSFMAEWLMVSVVILGVALVYGVVLLVTMLPQGGIGTALIQSVATIVAYPLVVAGTRFLFGLRKPATGEVDALGRRV